eukprot:sb/3469299/
MGVEYMSQRHVSTEKCDTDRGINEFTNSSWKQAIEIFGKGAVCRLDTAERTTTTSVKSFETHFSALASARGPILPPPNHPSLKNTKGPFLGSRTTLIVPPFCVNNRGHSFKAITIKLWESVDLVVYLVLKLGQRKRKVITKVMTVLSFRWGLRQPSRRSKNTPLGTWCCLDILNIPSKFQANPSYGSSVTSTRSKGHTNRSYGFYVTEGRILDKMSVFRVPNDLDWTTFLRKQ